MKIRDRNKIIKAISYSSANRAENFLSLKSPEQIEVILLLSKHVQLQLLKDITDQDLIRLINHLDPNDATDIIQLLPSTRQKDILSHLNEYLKSHVTNLLAFDQDTAAGFMNVDYIQVVPRDTVSSVAKSVKRYEKRTGKVPTILIVDQSGLSGQLPIHELAFAKPTDYAINYSRKISTIDYNVKSDGVVDYFRSHPHSKVVVIGRHKNVLGIIYIDDILELLHTDETSSLYDFAGVSEEESIYDNVTRKVNFRYKWLLINLATSFLAAFTVGLFDEIISKYVLLAVYMPIVAGMGGNSATQTLAVMVRGLSQGEVKSKILLQTLKNEIMSGIINGVINGLIVVLVIYLLDGDLYVGIVLGLAMIVNLFIAGTFGTLVPVVMKKLGKDPASSATIFITTATDIFGFLTFLGLATIILK
jgi:magnesium transporter